MLVGALPAAFPVRCLPNPVASDAVTPSLVPPPLSEQRRALAEEALKRQFPFLHPELVQAFFFWSHFYLTCTDTTFTHLIERSHDPDRHRS